MTAPALPFGDINAAVERLRAVLPRGSACYSGMLEEQLLARVVPRVREAADA